MGTYQMLGALFVWQFEDTIQLNVGGEPYAPETLDVDAIPPGGYYALSSWPSFIFDDGAPKSFPGQSQADARILAGGFNGNDHFAVSVNGIETDTWGVLGEEGDGDTPYWTVNGVINATRPGHTIIRKDSVTGGNPNWQVRDSTSGVWILI